RSPEGSSSADPVPDGSPSEGSSWALSSSRSAPSGRAGSRDGSSSAAEPVERRSRGPPGSPDGSSPEAGPGTAAFSSSPDGEGAGTSGPVAGLPTPGADSGPSP